MDALNKIIEKVNQIISTPNNEIDQTQYKEINQSDFNGKILFIDGGNNEIIKTPSFSVHLVRVFYCIYHDNKRIKSEKKEFYLLVKAVNNEKLSFEAESFPVNYEFDVMNINPEEISSKQNLDIGEVVNIVMKCVEIKIATEAIEHLDAGDIIVRDGDLKQINKYEKAYFTALFQIADNNNITITALAKTSDLLTDKGDSFSATLSKNQPYPTWFYTIDDQTYFTKLNPKSRFIFKFQTHTGHTDILSSLAENSKDPVFIGYPYGLIEADKFARVSNRETEIARIKFLTKTKNKELLENYQNALSAHDVLDNI